MTRTAADVQAEIDRAEAEESAFFARRGWIGDLGGWRPATDDEYKELSRISQGLSALRAEYAVAERHELDAEVDRLRRHEALRLRAIFRGEKPNPQLWIHEVCDAEWAALPIEEARGWARVEAEMP